MKNIIQNGKGYKFISFEENAEIKISTLLSGKVWFSLYKTLNDDTEFKVDYGETDKTIGKRLDDKDARRKIYYTHYTDRVWGSPENYHAMLNSGELGEELCVRIIRELYQSE